MKSAHLTNVERRCQRVLAALLPEQVERGTGVLEVGDPHRRLREIIRRVANLDTGEAGEVSAGNVVTDLVTLLETDVPELIDAVRQAQGAQRRYCQYCGERRVGLLVASPEDRSAWQCRDEDGCDVRSDRRDAAKSA